MPISTISNTTSPTLHLYFDHQGFLIEPRFWSTGLAEQIANREGIFGLQAKHWLVIHLIRGYFLKRGAPPSMRQVCRRVRISKYQTIGLFACCEQAWKIAGLPNPGQEMQNYLH